MLFFAFVPSVAQAGDGAFVSLGLGAQLEGKLSVSGPLEVRGAASVVEAGWAFDGGTVLLYEVGLFGATNPDARLSQQLGLLGGVRLDLVQRGRLIPFMRGGMTASVVRTAGTRALGLGPYLGLGAAVELVRGVLFSLAAVVRSNVAPFSVHVGGAACLTVVGP